MEKSFKHDVFLSYSSKDVQAVQGIARRLRIDGIRVWFDQFAIGPGDVIPAKLQEGLAQSRLLALFMSPQAVTSDWVLIERSVVLFPDPLNRERRFAPVLLHDCEIPEMLLPYRYIDLRHNFEAGYQELLEFCRPKSETSISSLSSTQEDGVVKSEREEARGQCLDIQGSQRAAKFPRLSRPDYLR